MRILIWGAGAIGGTVGAYLARAGHEIHFVDVVEDHVRAINEDGMRIKGPIDDFSVRARACLPETLQGEFDTIFLCVKAQHTADATNALSKHLSRDGVVVSLQNGLNELIIRDIVGADRTMGAFINFSADYHAPGEILYGGRGAVVLGELDGRMSARLQELAEVMRGFDADAIATDDIFAYLWGKEAYGAMLFVSALTHESIADALASPRYRPLYIGAAQEILTLADALGISPRGFNGFEPARFLASDEADIHASLDALVAFNRTSAKTHSGIWRDLAVRKRATEVVMYQPIVAESERLGNDIPLTRRWIAMIHEIENGEREQRIENLDELMAELA